MDKSNSLYCPRIFHGLTLKNITRHSFDYSVCCWFKDVVKNPDSINFHHHILQDLRSVNQQGHLPMPQCSGCIIPERAGSASMRNGYVDIHGPATYDPVLKYLDINIDYTCNSACVTCGPTLSTTWRRELKIKGPSPRPLIDKFLESLDSLNLDQLEEVAIWGGEPFLTNTHIEILEYFVAKGLAPQIRLMYNTNGTRRINDQTRELLEKFKFVRISFSVDAINDRFHYIRYPAHWNEVENNLLWWRENLPHNSMLSITVTISLLNAFYVNEVVKWHQENFAFSKYGDPIELYSHPAEGDYGLEYLPQQAAHYLKSINNHALSWVQNFQDIGKKTHLLHKTLDLIRQNDLRRNLDLAQFCPEVAELIGYQK